MTAEEYTELIERVSTLYDAVALLEAALDAVAGLSPHIEVKVMYTTGALYRAERLQRVAVGKHPWFRLRVGLSEVGGEGVG